ncbi:uncharacterized protein LOC133903239 [Phragmites australis]|uniref:uncharacterized protein LOC133903239 n=1 Tax=Phragmites australis TaxID=29695 RepID=UPI002D79B2D5|nr:uncharacterized protein LOC133903239 [Phragmites australis]
MSGVHVESKMEKNGVMRMHVVVVCSAVGILGLVVAILGVAGEASTEKALVRGDTDSGNDSFKCVYRTTSALGCGIVAALLALTAQVVVTAASVCCGCCRTWEVPTKTRPIVGIVLSAVSWVMVIIVAALFIAGAALNTDGERRPTADNKCYVDPGSPLFAAATVLSLVATGLQIASYILLQETPTGGSTKTPAKQQPAELATGQPVQLEPQQDAEKAVAGGDQPPSAPALSEAREPTGQV